METTRAGIAIYKINYLSDFILTVVCDVEWGTPFCIKFWTGEPAQAYYVGWTGTEYKNCKVVESDPSKLLVLFDDHHLPVGELKMQIVYHTTIEDFPNAIVDEVTNSMKVMAYIDGKNQKIALDFEGEEDAELQFELPAYANEAQRIANEEQRIANEQARIEAEQQRIDNEQTRQNNEAQRIAQETARVNEYAELKADAVAATNAANDAATLANQKAQLAADKAALADAAATLANQKAALAQQKAEYADAQGDYAKEQGDYAKEQGDTALADHRRAESDHETAASDHTIAANDHTQAGNDHTRAESDHSTAADDHTLAASDHSTAAADHTLAASDHSTAADDHTLAASDHSTAANDHTQAGNDHTRAESDHTRAESDHAAVEVYVDSLGAFDISSYHATGGVLAKYADLTAALGTNGANIPEAIRKGGMSVKFVQSSDNKYVQYRLMSDSFNTTSSNWQSMNADDVPTAGSKNLVESGGVHNFVGIVGNSLDTIFEGFDWKGGFYSYTQGVFTTNSTYVCTQIITKDLEESIVNIDKVGTQTTGITKNSHKSLFFDGIYVGYLLKGVYKNPSNETVNSIEYNAFAINERITSSDNPGYSDFYTIHNIQGNKADIDNNKNMLCFGTLQWREGFYSYAAAVFGTNSTYRCTYLFDKKYEPLISNIDKVGTQTSGVTKNSHKSLFLNGDYVGYLLKGVYKTPNGTTVESIEYDAFAINEYITSDNNPNYATYYVFYGISTIKSNIDGLTREKFKFNRVFYALGDSTTIGYGASNPDKSWPNVLNSLVELNNFSNIAISGSFCVYHEGSGRLSTQVTSVPQDINGIVTIMIGTNDFFYDSPLGNVNTTLAKAYSELTDTDNFADAFRYNLETLKRKCPDAIIICMTPLPSNDVGNTHGHLDETNLNAIRQIEKDICGAMGIPIVDTAKEFGMTRYVADWSHFFTDFCHPNDAGYDRIAHCMLGKFIELAQ